MEESVPKKTIQTLLEASPLTLALVVLVLLLALLLLVVYRVVPHLVTRREEERRKWDERRTQVLSVEYAKASRVEDIAARVHRLTAQMGRLDLLAGKVKDLEEDLKEQGTDASQLRAQIADLVGTTRELNVKVDSIADRMDRDAEAISSRLSSLEEGVRNISQPLLAFLGRVG